MKMEKIRESAKRICKDIKEYSPAAVIFLVYYLLVHFTGNAFCPMISLTGFPCAGCGLTRAFLYMALGQFKRAAYINPMAFVIVLFLAYCGYFRYIRGTKIKGFKVLFTALVISMLVFYAVRMYLFFPGRVPYVYTEDNVFSKRIPGYRNMAKGLVQLIKDLRS